MSEPTPAREGLHVAHPKRVGISEAGLRAYFVRSAALVDAACDVWLSKRGLQSINPFGRDQDARSALSDR